jgi:EAL domain-containing protein (putative c-di-GMP-specific phosphodiesterase class I)
MTAAAHAPRPLRPLFEQLERDHFPASEFSEPYPGTVAARFFQSRLTSAFHPIVRASDGGATGHQALLRVFDAGDKAVAPWSLFAQASGDDMLVQLDRLCRTVHALNYFPWRDENLTLFLNVEPRLLGIVADDHGAYFELILSQLGVAPRRVAIVLAADALDDPVTFVRAAISYRIRGYRVVAQVRSARDADLEHLFLAEPHDVALDGPRAHDGDDTRRVLAALARRGIHAIARHVEDEAQAQAARKAGFSFLQGKHFSASAARP